MKLKVLDLFSGIGGFSLGLERTGGFETVAFCEYDTWLNSRLQNWHPDIPAFKDVRTITGDYHGSVDVITGGDPCQPSSTAGQRKGKEDDRYLWPAMSTAIKKFRPTWVIRENVRGNISNGILDTVELDLESAGYACRTFLLPAYAVGAWHERYRTWTVAYSESARKRRENRKVCETNGGSGGALLQQPNSASQNVANTKTYTTQRLPERETEEHARFSQCRENVADPASFRQSGSGKPIERRGSATQGKGQANKPLPIGERRKWPAEPNVGRVANGIPDRTHRLQALGNAIVPDFAYAIGHAILQAEAA